MCRDGSASEGHDANWCEEVAMIRTFHLRGQAPRQRRTRTPYLVVMAFKSDNPTSVWRRWTPAAVARFKDKGPFAPWRRTSQGVTPLASRGFGRRPIQTRASRHVCVMQTTRARPLPVLSTRGRKYRSTCPCLPKAYQAGSAAFSSLVSDSGCVALLRMWSQVSSTASPPVTSTLTDTSRTEVAGVEPLRPICA